MERILYLTEKKDTEVRRDGPSLWVKERTRAGYRIPARLLDMVVVIGNVRMDSGVVTIFSEQNIPVTFLNARGETIAIAMPYRDPSPDRREEQRRFFRIQGNMERFERWFYSRKRHVRLYVTARIEPAKARTFQDEGFRDADYLAFVRNHAAKKEKLWAAVKEQVLSLLRELLVEKLVRAGLDPHLGIFHRRCDFGFAMDFCDLVEAEADLQAIRFVNYPYIEGLFTEGRTRATLTKEGMKELIGRFEGRKMSVGRHVDSTIDSLFELFGDRGGRL
jgi:CRISPR/Cas system-associated endonuclease Cas1